VNQRLFSRVPTPPGKSWILLTENSRTWKVLKNDFGSGKSWKNILESNAFFECFKWKTSSNSVAFSLYYTIAYLNKLSKF